MNEIESVAGCRIFRDVMPAHLDAGSNIGDARIEIGGEH
jgi:hypothetical protein